MTTINLINEIVKRKAKEEMFLNGLFGANKPQFHLSSNFGATVNEINSYDAYMRREDVYFAVNNYNGKRSESNVVSFNTFFADFDCGEESKGKYHDISTVTALKEAIMDRIKLLPQYSALVETRNGYHVYWFINKELRSEVELSDWKEIQNLIVSVTESDSKVRDASRLLRVPGSLWCKTNKGNYNPFVTSIKHINELSYDPKELRVKFNEINVTKFGGTNIIIPAVYIVPTIESQNSNDNNSNNSNNNIDAIINLNYEYFNKLNNNSNKIKNYKEDAAKEYLHQQDLSSFLNVNMNHCCIFHDDRNPSARVLAPNKKHGSPRWSYICHSDKCRVSREMDIIDVVMTLSGADFNTALRFLCQCFNITLKSVGRHIDSFINSYMTTLDSISASNDKYKKKLQPLEDITAMMLSIAKKTATMTNTVYFANDVYFAASKGYLAASLGNSSDKVFRKTVLMAALGLIEKVNDDDLPQTIKDRDRLYNQELQLQYGSDRTIQYYRLVAIDNVFAIKNIKCQLDKWIAGKGQIKLINEDLAAKIFGQEMASRIYSKKLNKNQWIHFDSNIENVLAS